MSSFFISTSCACKILRHFMLSRELPLLSKYNRCKNSERTLLRIHPSILHGAEESISYHLRISAPYLPATLLPFPIFKIAVERQISDAIKPIAREQLMGILMRVFIDYYVKWKVRLDKYVRTSIGTLKGLKLNCSC